MASGFRDTTLISFTPRFSEVVTALTGRELFQQFWKKPLKRLKNYSSPVVTSLKRGANEIVE
jgi:hypothetical protein